MLGKAVVLGVHWENVQRHRTDLDLHFNSPKHEVGWNTQFEDALREKADILFSGDMTSALKSKGGATEAFYLSENMLFDTKALRALGEQRNLSSNQVYKYLRRVEAAGMIYMETYTQRENSSRWKFIVPIPKSVFTKGTLEENARREAARKYAFDVCAEELERLRRNLVYETNPLIKQKTVNGGVLTERAQRLFEIIQASRDIPEKRKP